MHLLVRRSENLRSLSYGNIWPFLCLLALGVELSGQLVITSISPGSKADRCGLRVGDRVVNLNGIDAAHLSLIDAAHMMRREQSDVTLMRVEHPDYGDDGGFNEGRDAGRLICLHTDGEGGDAVHFTNPPTTPVPEYENMRFCGRQCCAQHGAIPSQGIIF